MVSIMKACFRKKKYFSIITALEAHWISTVCQKFTRFTVARFLVSTCTCILEALAGKTVHHIKDSREFAQKVWGVEGEVTMR